MKRPMLSILPLLCAVAATRILGAMVLPVYDDAFITFRYAKNLVETGSFVYNAGEWVLGTTAPLFGLISALFYVLHLPMPASIVVLNLLIDLVLAYVIFRFVSKEFSYNAAVFAVLFFAVSPILVRISVGGMEANLFVLVIMSSLLLYRSDKKFAAIVLASLSYFIRPEGALLAMFLVGSEVLAKRYVSAIKLACISAITVAPGLILLTLSYGTFVPQSVAAKAGQHLPIVEVFKRLVLPEAAAIAFVVLSLFAIVLMYRSKKFIATYAAFVLIYFGAYLVMRPWVWSWYAMPIQTALVIGAGIGTAVILERFVVFSRPVWQRAASLAGVVCVMGVWGAIFVMKGSSGITSNIYGSLASTSPSLVRTSVLATDIGAIGYFSNAQVYDGLGLVTPDAAQHANLDSMILAAKPDAVFLNTSLETKKLMDKEYFSSVYTSARRYGPSGDSTLPADPATYVDGWQQDYLLFVKR